jgi:hypothetical protein
VDRKSVVICLFLQVSSGYLSLARAEEMPKNYPSLCQKSLQDELASATTDLGRNTKVVGNRVDLSRKVPTNDGSTVWLLEMTMIFSSYKENTNTQWPYVCIASKQDIVMFGRKEFRRTPYGDLLSLSLVDVYDIPIQPKSSQSKNSAPALPPKLNVNSVSRVIGVYFVGLSKTDFCLKYVCKAEKQDNGSGYQFSGYSVAGDPEGSKMSFIIEINKSNGIAEKVTMGSYYVMSGLKNLINMPRNYIDDWFNLMTGKTMSDSQYKKCLSIFKEAPKHDEFSAKEDVVLFEDDRTIAECYYSAEEGTLGYKIVLKSSALR